MKIMNSQRLAIVGIQGKHLSMAIPLSSHLPFMDKKLHSHALYIRHFFLENGPQIFLKVQVSFTVR